MRVLFEIPTWIGDVVMITPALDNFFVNFPMAEVTLLGSKTALEVLSFNKKISSVIVLESGLRKNFKFIKQIDNHDYYVSFRNSLRSKILFFFTKKSPKHFFNSKDYKNLHQVEKYNQFLLNIFKFKNKPGKLNLYKSVRKKKDFPLKIGISPGASYGSAKQWGFEKFTDFILQNREVGFFYIFGGAGEISLCNQMEKELRKRKVNNFINLAGKTTVRELVSNISHLSFFVTGDSGPMHIAAAFQVPTVAIFGPTIPGETSQWLNDKNKIVKLNLDCQPCMKRVCPLGHHNCMKMISSERVSREVKNLISLN